MSLLTDSAQQRTKVQPGIAASAGAPIIQVRDLQKVFSSKGKDLVVFDRLSCQIEKRSFLSIIGPSGCGKSTLLKLISGLEPATGGQIDFNGTIVRGPPKGMIYVFQQYTKSIFPWRTVIDNIEFGLLANSSLGRKQRRERCREYIDLVGLNGYEDYHPYQLSDR